MKRFLAILVCKLGHWLGKQMGKGSSMPGKYALKICPDILSQIILPLHIIAVTGSNGKTSTVEMIAAILRSDGKTVVCNEEGSNQIEGVATAILSACTFDGILNADVLLLESDERYAAQSFKFFHPTIFVVTNLYRDQLTRNGHPEWVFDALRPAMFPDSKLILNADDPLSSCLGANHSHVVWFGLERGNYSFPKPTGVYNDGAYCPVCKTPMEYFFAHFNHIGGYYCPNCEHNRPIPDYAGTQLDLETGMLTINESLSVHLAFRSLYNVYNVLAAFSAAHECGANPYSAIQTINNYVLKNGRMVHFLLGAHGGTLLVSKHENSVAYDTNLRYIRNEENPCTVVIIVDSISRKYFTSETSWLWDIDFEQLHCNSVQKILLCGRYANDLALRMSYTSIQRDKWEIHTDIAEACEQLKNNGSEDLYVVTCFTDKDKLLSLTEREGM